MENHRILFAASEVTPLAKVGGLGDVIGALPKALAELGEDVRVILPYYEVIAENASVSAEFRRDFSVRIGKGTETVKLFETILPESNVPLYLLRNDHYLSRGDVYFERSGMVGGIAEVERFIFFSLAVKEFLAVSEWQPELVHAHDWHMGVLPGLLKNEHRIKTLFTVHNLQNQGQWNANEILALLGEGYPNLYGEKDFNCMAEGIRNADEISTVSPTYAKEILTQEFGCGLDGQLQSRSKNLIGIVNGIDTGLFNPASDTFIAETYDAESAEKRQANKLWLQKTCGLAIGNDHPLFGVVSRLTWQKGMELIVNAMPEFIATGAQLVVLGKGDPTIEAELAALASKYPEAVSVKFGFDAALAQQIYAGCDFFLMPSRFEPCGLGQLIAMRYGAIPIVRGVGGLADTVRQCSANAGNGFRFDTFAAEDLGRSIKDALAVWRQPAAFAALVRRAMTEDFSWTSSARRYKELYRDIIEKDA